MSHIENNRSVSDDKVKDVVANFAETVSYIKSNLQRWNDQPFDIKNDEEYIKMQKMIGGIIDLWA